MFLPKKYFNKWNKRDTISTRGNIRQSQKGVKSIVCPQKQWIPSTSWGLLNQPCVSVRFNIQGTFVSVKPWLMLLSSFLILWIWHNFPQFTHSQHVGSLFFKALTAPSLFSSPKNYKNDSNLYKDANFRLLDIYSLWILKAQVCQC